MHKLLSSLEEWGRNVGFHSVRRSSWHQPPPHDRDYGVSKVWEESSYNFDYHASAERYLNNSARAVAAPVEEIPESQQEGTTAAGQGIPESPDKDVVAEADPRVPRDDFGFDAIFKNAFYGGAPSSGHPGAPSPNERGAVASSSPEDQLHTPHDAQELLPPFPQGRAALPLYQSVFVAIAAGATAAPPPADHNYTSSDVAMLLKHDRPPPRPDWSFRLAEAYHPNLVARSAQHPLSHHLRSASSRPIVVYAASRENSAAHDENGAARENGAAELKIGRLCQPAGFWDTAVPDATLRSTISREHFVIRPAVSWNPAWLIVECLSNNGVLFNGEHIEKGTIKDVKHGDMLGFVANISEMPFLVLRLEVASEAGREQRVVGGVGHGGILFPEPVPVEGGSAVAVERRNVVGEGGGRMLEGRLEDGHQYGATSQSDEVFEDAVEAESDQRNLNDSPHKVRAGPSDKAVSSSSKPAHLLGATGADDFVVGRWDVSDEGGRSQAMRQEALFAVEVDGVVLKPGVAPKARQIYFVPPASASSHSEGAYKKMKVGRHYQERFWMRLVPEEADKSDLPLDVMEIFSRRGGAGGTLWFRCLWSTSILIPCP